MEPVLSTPLSSFFPSPLAKAPAKSPCRPSRSSTDLERANPRHHIFRPWKWQDEAEIDMSQRTPASSTSGVGFSNLPPPPGDYLVKRTSFCFSSQYAWN